MRVDILIIKMYVCEMFVMNFLNHSDAECACGKCALCCFILSIFSSEPWVSRSGRWCSSQWQSDFRKIATYKFKYISDGEK